MIRMSGAVPLNPLTELAYGTPVPAAEPPPPGVAVAVTQAHTVAARAR